MNAVAVLMTLASAGAECPPTAVVEGSGASAQELIAALNARGVRVEPPGLPPGECDVLHVKLTRHANGLTVAIDDPWGRSAERTVKSALTAATLVETWARMDLLEGTQGSTRAVDTPAIAAEEFAPLPPEQPVVEAPKELSPVRPIKPEQTTANLPVPTTSPPPDEQHTLIWKLGAEIVLSDEHDRWFGVVGSVCARAAIFCIGASARYDHSLLAKSTAEAFVDLSAPIAFGPIALTPGLGFGGGWRTDEGADGARGSRRREQLRFDNEPSVEPSEEHSQQHALGARAEARLDASIRVFSNLSLQLGVSGTIEPNFDRHLDLDEPVFRALAGLSWGVQ